MGSAVGMSEPSLMTVREIGTPPDLRAVLERLAVIEAQVATSDRCTGALCVDSRAQVEDAILSFLRQGGPDLVIKLRRRVRVWIKQTSDDLKPLGIHGCALCSADESPITTPL